MRVATVSSIKDNRGPLQIAPREGTRVAMLHQFFLQNRGRIVTFSRDKKLGHTLDRLKDDWGLDIRRARYSRRHWMLFGEWFGRKYVDYTTVPSTEDVPRDWAEWQLNPPSSAEAS